MPEPIVAGPCGHNSDRISTIRQTISGTYPPPMSRDIIASWASALELSGNDRARFFLLADVSRSPVAVQKLIDIDKAMDRLVEYNASDPLPHNFFGDRLAAHLEKGHHQLLDIANTIGMELSYLERIISGHEPPTPAHAKALAKAMGLSNVDLLELTQLAAIAQAPSESRPEYKEILDYLLENTRKAEMIKKTINGG